MVIKSVGRNHKLSEEEVRSVIRLFKENEQPIGNIKYSEIHKFANKLFESNELSASTSDSFWRKEGRLGRSEVDKANRVFSETIVIAKDLQITVPNVVDLVNKKYKNKEELLTNLIIMEKQFHSTLQREKKLKEANQSLEENLKIEKIKKKSVEQQNSSLQELVYLMWRILSETSNPEVQQKTDYAMKTVFSSPTSFLEFKERNEKLANEVIPFNLADNSKTKFSSRFRKS
ncbi:hypothetical protein [Gottfriedia acidiceleris]|uniref:hypothetical protein n=1 Tax=Gottfriedia acidiceleris TaxID=371036 RepID=UPI001F212ED1|nr:hypothetical protein [Gottfriedia acidiceleris]